MAAMRILALVWLALFPHLADHFSGVEVEGEGVTDDRMEVDIEVGVHESEGPVVAHLVLPGQPEQIKSLARREDDRWGAVLELRRANWTVVFEDVATGSLSEEASLIELGLDRSLLGGDPVDEPGTGDASSVALPAAVLTFVGVLTLLGFWFVYRRSAVDDTG